MEHSERTQSEFPRPSGVARGKLLLFGEHAAVYGYPAIGTALPLETRARFRDQAGRELTAPPWGDGSEHAASLTFDLAFDLGALSPPDRDPVRAALQRLIALMRSRPSTFFQQGVQAETRSPALVKLEIESQVPRSVGLGSSAAVCSAISAAALPGLAPRERWAAANELERQFHGTPSGIDTGLATLGGTLAFRFLGTDLPDAVPVALPAGYLVVAAVPRESSTKELIAGLRRRIEAQGSTPHAALAPLGEIASEVLQGLEDGPALTISRLARHADTAHALLQNWGLSTRLLDAALDHGRSAGALGGKLSGAGGGGAFYLLFADHDRAEHGRDALEAFLRQRIGRVPDAALPLIVPTAAAPDAPHADAPHAEMSRITAPASTLGAGGGAP